MSMLRLLFKKDIIESLYSFRRKKKDILGLVSSFLLLVVIYGTFVYVFNHFAKMYVGTIFGDVLAGRDRIIELFTLGFGVIFLVNVVVGVRKIYSLLVNGKDNDVLVYQPIDTGVIFIYKLIKIYLSQVVSTILITLPVAIVIDLISSSVGGFIYYLLLLIVVSLLPLISCAFASILSVPCISIIRKISSKFVVTLLIFVVLIAAGFYLYGTFLNVLGDLIRSGNIKYVFDLKTIDTIHNVTDWLYPGKFFTNIMLRENTLVNILLVLGISVIAVVVSYYMIREIYKNIIQRQLEGNQKVYHNNVKLKKHNSIFALLYKEFVVVLRTPSYAFQYFAMSISLPFMVYVCASLLESMIETLTIIDCNYALAILVVSMFSILTNTFCTTNISRDGKMFSLMKTMPLSIKQIINVKLMFCSIVSFVSVFISCLVLLISGYLNFFYFLVTFVVGFLFSLVQIAYATRKDMKNPSFPNNIQEEITEGSSNMSTLILTGLITTIVAGGGSVLISLILGMAYNERIASIVSICFVLAITIIACIVSFAYLFKGLEKEYYLSEI